MQNVPFSDDQSSLDPAFLVFLIRHPVLHKCRVLDYYNNTWYFAICHVHIQTYCSPRYCSHRMALPRSGFVWGTINTIILRNESIGL